LVGPCSGSSSPSARRRSGAWRSRRLELGAPSSPPAGATAWPRGGRRQPWRLRGGASRRRRSRPPGAGESDAGSTQHSCPPSSLSPPPPRFLRECGGGPSGCPPSSLSPPRCPPFTAHRRRGVVPACRSCFRLRARGGCSVREVGAARA
jgi:hypothetical protein